MEVTIATRVNWLVGQGKDALFGILWANGTTSWEPYDVISHLSVLSGYLEASGCRRIEDLPEGPVEEPALPINAMGFPDYLIFQDCKFLLYQIRCNYLLNKI